MRNVVFVLPFPFEESLRFLRAVAALPDVRVLGVHQRAPTREEAPLHDAVEIADGLDPQQIITGIEILRRKHGPISRIVGVLEPLQHALALAREHFDVPGPRPATAERFRDKAVMKDALRAAGIPCARHSLLTCAADAQAFVRHVGFPIVMKPPQGVGCRSTYRIDGPAELATALQDTRPSPGRPVLAEEFLTGEERTFDALTLGGEVVFHSISHYRPSPLDAMRNPWIQYVVQLPRDISGPEYAGARDIGFRTIRALGLDHGMTHMEWFRRADGSVAVGEIAMRPPGVNLVPMMNEAYETSLYRAWARAVVDQAFDGPWRRRWSVGCAFLRGTGRGRVVAVEGLEEAQRAVKGMVVSARLPRYGQPKADGYEGEGFVILRHEDDRALSQALSTLIETVKVRYA